MIKKLSKTQYLSRFYKATKVFCKNNHLKLITIIIVCFATFSVIKLVINQIPNIVSVDIDAIRNKTILALSQNSEDVDSKAKYFYGKLDSILKEISQEEHLVIINKKNVIGVSDITPRVEQILFKELHIQDINPRKNNNQYTLDND